MASFSVETAAVTLSPSKGLAIALASSGSSSPDMVSFSVETAAATLTLPKELAIALASSGFSSPDMVSFSVEAAAATLTLPKELAFAVASSGSSSPENVKQKEAALEPTYKEEWQSLGKKMAEMRDAIFDAQLEAVKAKFELDETLRRHHMERGWMEMKIMSERALIDSSSSPSVPYIKGIPHIVHGTMRVHDIIMTMSYDRVTALPSVNQQLRAALRKISPASFRSEQLKRKWALQEVELISNEAKRAKLLAAMKKRHSSEEIMKLQEENTEQFDEEEDDGKLSDVKRLDKEIESKKLGPYDWRKRAKESYKWYYPYAELISREGHLTRMAESLAELAEERGTAVPTESEVIGCMLLDHLATAALSASDSTALFPAP